MKNLFLSIGLLFLPHSSAIIELRHEVSVVNFSHSSSLSIIPVKSVNIAQFAFNFFFPVAVFCFLQSTLALFFRTLLVCLLFSLSSLFSFLSLIHILSSLSYIALCFFGLAFIVSTFSCLSFFVFLKVVWRLVLK